MNTADEHHPTYDTVIVGARCLGAALAIELARAGQRVLVAGRRPFISLPLSSHVEQRFHVRHRLDRYGARTWLDYDNASPHTLADAIASAVDTAPSYRPVDASGRVQGRRADR